jgi:hypothetical protein
MKHEVLEKMMESIADFLYHSGDGDVKKLVLESLSLMLLPINDPDGIKLAIFCREYNKLLQ